MTMTFYNNYNVNDGVTDNSNDSNNDNNNNNNNSSRSGRNSIEFTATSNSALPSCSTSISAVVESGMKWKTNVVPGCTTPSTVTLPRRDFHFKRIEVEETPKWFVWPKRNKESKSSRSGKNVSHGKSISSSDGNSISRPGLLLSRNSSAMPQKITNLTNVNSNRKQNLTGQRMTLAQSESENTIAGQAGARQYRQRELLYRSITGTELINIPSSEPSSYVMRCHIAARVDNEQRVVGSAPSSSQTFKILSISKKPLESGDDEDFDLTNSVILTCRQSRPQPTVALSHSTKTGDTAVKGVH